MKKRVPYFLIAFVFIAVIVLLMLQQKKGQKETKRLLNERVSFRIRDKIPYGMYAAYTSLQSFFPRAEIGIEKNEPGYWDELSEYDKRQALMIVTPELRATEYEMKNLVSFVEAGNSVIISTMNISYDAAKLLHCTVRPSIDQLYYYLNRGEDLDTLTVALSRPPFAADTLYSYPGKKYDGYFSQIDSSLTTVLGYDQQGRPNFIRLKAGDGSLYVHLAPMAFSNYFLLHKNNLGYYEQVLSVIPPGTNKIAWDEYFLSGKQRQEQRSSGWLSVFLQNKSLRYALLTAIIILIVYILMEMRRKQRIIPFITPPRNDSLDFVKTVGRLYHDKGDHKNLCRKMAAYFLEHVRSQYKLPTTLLNDEFIALLKFKSGAGEEEIRAIVSFINSLGHVEKISHEQLVRFHKQLENFYRNA